MRKQWAFGPAIVAFVAAQSALAGNIDEGLKSVMNAAQAGDIISTLVFLNEQVDIDLLNAQLDLEHAKLQRRHEVVVRALQQVAADTQNVFLNDMRRLEAAGRIERLHAYWISNVFRIDAPVEELGKIAAHASVKTVYFNYEIELIEPVESNPGGISSAVTNSLREIRAPEAWALGYDGSGVLVSNMDTGVDGNHPALADRWAGVADPRYAGHPEWAWFDPFGGQNDFPRDFNGHGTHTMGTICGGAPGREIGVAPGAIWMGSSPIDRQSIARTVADALLSFEWMLDPDGNPSTNWDVPAVNSNSWGLTTGHGFPPCDETFWSHLDACEAAGIVILFSAGNEGTSGLRRPADRATDEYRTCAVAAVDCENSTFPWPIAGFSSRGPTFCTPGGGAAIKPDISAPGVNVDSAAIGGGYRRLSGTSMASPHVNGVVALIRQACPDLTVPEVKQVLYDSAVDLGDPGEDNIFGWGNINAEAAVLLALELCIDSEGQIDLDSAKYACEDQVNVIVRDLDLNLDPNTVEVVDITIESDSEPVGEIITLTETGPDTSRFEALVPISETNA
ncbi:MAG: S8 family serine peptidase, partial [Planctomycetes bacterium]|nr:S8 family serine peptidase [Planctomycetota bacterium]